jgi:hypothetical protein
MATRPELGVIVVGGCTFLLASWHLAKLSSAFDVSDTVAECIFKTWWFAHVSKLPPPSDDAARPRSSPEARATAQGQRRRGGKAGAPRGVCACVDTFTWFVVTTRLHGVKRISATAFATATRRGDCGGVGEERRATAAPARRGSDAASTCAARRSCWRTCGSTPA